MIDLDHAQQTHAIVVVGLLVLWVGFWTSAVLWRQGKQIERLDADLDQAWGWVQDAHAVLFGGAEGWGGDPAPAPLPLESEPPTLRADPADDFARRQWLLHRRGYVGQHRA